MKTWLLLAAIFLSSSCLLDHLKPVEVTAQASGLPGIDAVYCINLDMRPEKWKLMQEQFNKAGIVANRMSAINGWKDLSKVVREELQAPNQVKLCPGQIGCFLSHLSILQDAKNREFNRVLVLEDDIQFNAEVKDLGKYIELLSRQDPEWDLLFLDDWRGEEYGVYEPIDRPNSTMSMEIKKPKASIAADRLKRIYYRHGTYAYILSNKGIQKILKHFSTHSLSVAYDVELNHINQIRMYEMTKKFVKVNLLISDTSKKPKSRRL